MKVKVLVTEEVCLSAIRGAIMNRRKAMAAEFSVGLAIFLGEGKADIQAKKLIRSIYASVGLDCVERTGNDYSAIAKRIDAMADLFDRLGAKAVFGWTAGAIDFEAIEKISTEIERLELYTVKDVLNYCQPHRIEKPAMEKVETIPHIPHAPFMRRASDIEADGTIHVRSSGCLDIAIAPEVTADELKDAAQKLLELAFERMKIAA